MNLMYKTGTYKSKKTPPSEPHITPEALPSTATHHTYLSGHTANSGSDNGHTANASLHISSIGLLGDTGSCIATGYYDSDWMDYTYGVTGTINVTSGSIATGISNIAYGSYGTPSTGSYFTVGGGIPLTNSFSSYGNYTYPATYTVTATLPYNDEQNAKIEKLEERIRDLESKMEKLLEALDEKTVYKILI